MPALQKGVPGGGLISVIATKPKNRAHIDPILSHMPARVPADVCLVSSYGDLVKAQRAGYRRIVLTQHGAGQSYSDRHPSYPGGRDNDAVGLFLVPNEHAARRWRDAYPESAVAVVGSPRLDTLPAREPGPVTVAVSFHWDMRGIPEARSAFSAFSDAIVELAARFAVIGHSHPDRRNMGNWYRRRGIEYVPDFDDVCRRADVYVCDNSSTIFEFAATGRPVVLMNAPWYRRDVNHGLRFWDAAGVGANVDDPDRLGQAVAEALEESPASAASREEALSHVYAYRSGGGHRAAETIAAWA